MECEWINNSLRIVLIFSLLTVALSKDSLSPGPTVYVIANSNLTFSCTTAVDWGLIYFRDYGIQSGNTSVVIFQRNTTHCRPVFTETRFGADKYFASPCYVNQPVSIKIRYINSTYHNKTIECLVDKREAVKTVVKIREILTKPSMTSSGKQTIREMVSVNFTCTAKSIPKPSIEWYLNGSKVTSFIISSNPTEDTMISTFTYQAKKEDHNSEVFCSANDTFTTLKSLAAELNITYVPTIRLEPTHNPYKVYEEQKNVMLTCVVEDANPWNEIQYQWTTPYGVIENQLLSISNISKNLTGQYSCTASNLVGKSENKTKKVEVEYGPLIGSFNTSIIEGKNLTITPYIDAHPAPLYFYWTRKDGNIDKHHGRSLIINPIQINASGYYVFHATNTLAPSGMNEMNRTSQKTSYIDVLYVPKIHMEPDYNPYILYEMQRNVELTCVVEDANPVIDIHFQWNTTTGTRSNEHVNITTVKLSHGGNYSCTAINQAGISFPSTKRLVVQYGPSISNISYQENIKEEDHLVLSPIVDANPAAELVWWRKHNDIKFEFEGTVLIMKNISRHESGNYSCYAMNILTPSGHTEQNRTDEWIFVINVQYAPSTKIVEAPRFEVLEYNNMTIHCTVTDANPIFSSISWYRNTTKLLENSENYTINNIHRSDAGYYICDARNTIGNGRTSVYINVLYGPDIKRLMVINGSTVMENSTVVLKCEIDSNPVPTVKWAFNNETLADNGLMGEISYYTIINTNCFHTGTYGCSAINNISSVIYNASKEVQLIINCSPTLNIKMEQPPRKIGLPLGGTLDINVNIVAYPVLSTIEWIFQPNLTNVTFIMNGTLESIFFRHKLQLHKSNLSEYDFGDYILDVKNIVGSMKLLFQVVPEGPPEPSTLINVTCSLQTILVFWITSFSGGGIQNFSIIAVSKNKQNHINTDVVSSTKGEIKHTSFNMPPSEYTLSILGENRYDSAVSMNSMSCQVKDTPKTEKQSIIAAAAGGGVGAAVILIGFTVLGLLIVRKRRKLKGTRLGECSGKLTDEDTDEGLKDNPLYGTTQSHTINSGTLNCQVNKTPISEEGEQECIDERCVYSQVHKNNNKGNKQKDIEMGSVYENSDKITKKEQTEEMYANTEGDTSTKQNKTVQSLPSKKNKDGLIYAELDLAPSGKQFVIRGIENRNNYAVIDLTKKAEPLPSDDEDVEQDDK